MLLLPVVDRVKLVKCGSIHKRCTSFLFTIIMYICTHAYTYICIYVASSLGRVTMLLRISKFPKWNSMIGVFFLLLSIHLQHFKLTVLKLCHINIYIFIYEVIKLSDLFENNGSSRICTCLILLLVTRLSVIKKTITP